MHKCWKDSVWAAATEIYFVSRMLSLREKRSGTKLRLRRKRLASLRTDVFQGLYDENIFPLPLPAQSPSNIYDNRKGEAYV